MGAYRTTLKRPTRESPFMLTYGIEAIIFAKIGIPAPRVQFCDMAKNDEELYSNMDLLDGLRDEASIKLVVQ